MKKYKGYLIDLDGTMYHGTERIESAVKFVNMLHEREIPYLFVTNNSVKTPEDVAAHLNKMDVPATSTNIITSAMATASYIKNINAEAKCLTIGGNGLMTALENEGLSVSATKDSADYVVMGLDEQINYEKLSQACLAVRSGAEFIATNTDRAIPTERGFLPGSGSLVSVVSYSTEVDPTVIGKPEKIIMEEALRMINLPREDVVMIGDNYQTDILAGIHAEIDTLLVFSGITKREELASLPKIPTYQIDSLEEWMAHV